MYTATMLAVVVQYPASSLTQTPLQSVVSRASGSHRPPSVRATCPECERSMPVTRTGAFRIMVLLATGVEGPECRLGLPLLLLQ